MHATAEVNARGDMREVLDDAVVIDARIGVDDDVPGLVHFVTVGFREGRSPHPLITKDFLEFVLGEK